ncbi:MAG: SPASM domain-containing protein [Thermoplasmatales archaeon]|nr:SPASM domain-containing protein [Thermoplasmatales archaeon]
MKRTDKYRFIDKKIVNRVKYWKEQKKWKLKNILDKETVKTIPLWFGLEIELQSDCNRNCFFCPRYEDRSSIRKDSNGKHTKKSMPTKKITDIIDEAEKLGFKGPIGFHRLSEPFLDKRYLELATYAKNKGMKVWENTNGDLLKNDPALCSKLDDLLTGITIGLYDYKNKKERNAQVRFWENRFKETNVVFSLAAEFPKIRQNSKLYDKKLVTSRIRNCPCFQTRVLRIRYDGEVSLCCQDDQCSFKLGNVFNSSIKDIWWSEKHIKIVNSLKVPGGRISYTLCSNCVSKTF